MKASGLDEFGHLTEEDSIFRVQYDDEERAKEVVKFSALLLLNMCIAGYLTYCLYNFYGTHPNSCIEDLMQWVFIYCLVMLLQIIRTLALILTYCVARDPGTVQIKLECFYGYPVILIEFGWIIYGWVVLGNLDQN